MIGMSAGRRDRRVFRVLRARGLTGAPERPPTSTLEAMMREEINKRDQGVLTVFEVRGSLNGGIADDHAVDVTAFYNARNISQLKFIKVRCNFENEFWFCEDRGFKSISSFCDAM